MAIVLETTKHTVTTSDKRGNGKTPAKQPKGILITGSVVQTSHEELDVVFTSNSGVAKKLMKSHTPFVWVRWMTEPSEMRIIEAAVGVMTIDGGITCHAAIVCAGMRKPCMVGCKDLKVHYHELYVPGIGWEREFKGTFEPPNAWFMPSTDTTEDTK